MQKNKIIPRLAKELVFDLEFYIMSTKALLEINREIEYGQSEVPIHSKAARELYEIVHSNTGTWSPQLYHTIKHYTDGILDESEVALLFKNWYKAELKQLLSDEQQGAPKVPTHKKHLKKMSTYHVDFFAEALKKAKPQLTSLVEQYEKIKFGVQNGSRRTIL